MTIGAAAVAGNKKNSSSRCAMVTSPRLGAARRAGVERDVTRSFVERAGNVGRYQAATERVAQDLKHRLTLHEVRRTIHQRPPGKAPALSRDRCERTHHVLESRRRNHREQL